MPALGLQPPQGRQGPGAVPRTLLDAIDLQLVRLVAHTLPGDRRAVGVGQGTELAQLRPYEPGDDVRHLDAAATARTGQPHVRLHVPERTLTTWVLLDVSPSMAFGTAARLKADVAEGVALVLARLAVRRAGSVGVIAYGAGEPIVLRPRGARPGLAAVRDLLAAGIAPDGGRDGDSLAAALRRLALLARRSSLVAIVSDFREQHDWARPLAGVCGRHAVLALEVHDPRESALPAVGRLALVDPESGERIEIDSSSPRLRARFEALERERREELAGTLRQLRVTHVALDTAGEWPVELARGLTAARARRRG
jgi:uncharacterized protein (DUF58 family)